MIQKIRITRKPAIKGEDGHKVISVRLRDSTLTRLDTLAHDTNRSRNELINLLLSAALEDVTIVDES